MVMNVEILMYLAVFFTFIILVLAKEHYSRISNNSYTPFPEKGDNYNSFINIKMKLFFYCSYSKTQTQRDGVSIYGETASRNENKLGINRTALQGHHEGEIPGVPSMPPCYVGLVSPSLTRRQVNTVELVTKAFLLFNVEVTQMY